MTWVDPSTRSSGYKVTAANWNELVNNFKHIEQIGLVGVTSSVVIDVTSAATSTLIVALPAITYTTDLHLLRLECGALQRTEVVSVSPTTIYGLYDGSAASPMTRIGQVQAPGNNPITVPISRNFYFFPTAASHTYQIRGYNNTADSWTWAAGAGGADVLMPIAVSIYRVAT